MIVPQKKKGHLRQMPLGQVPSSQLVEEFPSHLPQHGVSLSLIRSGLPPFLIPFLNAVIPLIRRLPELRVALLALLGRRLAIGRCGACREHPDYDAPDYEQYR
jgi:hypothetical protein